MASGSAPRSASGASRPTPLAPEVCATIVPGRTLHGDQRGLRRLVVDLGIESLGARDEFTC
ncbi:hypothetical protein, partial [Nocardia sp. NPDC004604]|uniref:hypothetical protein n=1 Tax=Nocardia sp. NPDC004604 TaxID=3157013 RepID=UPI0033BD2387